MMQQARKESIELTPRLKLIADRVPQGALLADIGTDHGHLPLYLLREGRIASAIASDIRSGPLEHAKENAAFHGFSEQTKFILAGGLNGVLEEDCDTIAIAGMGGETIIEILQAASWTRKGNHLLLLQPMTSVYELRQWLWANAFRIVEEAVCTEGRRHYVVLCVRGDPKMQWILKPISECCYSEALLKSEGAKSYLQHLLTREQRAYDGMLAGQSTDNYVREEQARLLKNLEHAMEEI